MLPERTMMPAPALLNWLRVPAPSLIVPVRLSRLVALAVVKLRNTPPPMVLLVRAMLPDRVKSWLVARVPMVKSPIIWIGLLRLRVASNNCRPVVSGCRVPPLVSRVAEPRAWLLPICRVWLSLSRA